MNIQDQTYFAIQARLERICRAEYNMVPKRHDGRPKKTITYPAIVDDLIKLSSRALEADDAECEAIFATITQGEIQDAYLKA